MTPELLTLFDKIDAYTLVVDAEDKATAEELAPFVPTMSDRELIDLWEEAEQAASLMGRVRDAIGERVHAQIALPVKDGERWYSYGGYKRTKILDKAQLLKYLGDRWPEAIAVERVRVTALDKIATDRGDDPHTIRNTFLDESWEGTRRLRAKPINKLPENLDLPELE